MVVVVGEEVITVIAGLPHLDDLEERMEPEPADPVRAKGLAEGGIDAGRRVGIVRGILV